MKKIGFLLIGTFIFIHAFAQERKTYKGEFEGSRTQGEATYQYFENADLERIYDGSFRYNSTDQIYGINILISGSYKNDLKNGLWTYKLSQIKPSGEIKSLSTTLTGEYLNGDLIKKWSLIRTTIFTSPFNYNDPNSNIINEKSFCSFSNGRFIGPFEFSMRSLRIKGSFDSYGFLDGEWRINSNFLGSPPFEEIRNYKNGICYRIISRNPSTGEIIYRYNNELVLLIFNQNKVVVDTTLTINQKKFKIQCIDGKVLENNNDDKFKGLSLIYDAIGFWMSGDPDDLYYGNCLYLINHGTNPISFPFEREFVEF